MPRGLSDMQKAILELLADTQNYQPIESIVQAVTDVERPRRRRRGGSHKWGDARQTVRRSLKRLQRRGLVKLVTIQWLELCTCPRCGDEHNAHKQTERWVLVCDPDRKPITPLDVGFAYSESDAVDRAIGMSAGDRTDK